MTASQQRLVIDNIYLVPFAIKRYVRISRALEADDVFSLGYIGLCNAALHFDVNKGKFSTFAVRCILNEINHTLRSMMAKSKDYRLCATTIDQPADGAEGADGDILGSFLEAVDTVESVAGASWLLRHIEESPEIRTDVVMMKIAGYKQEEIAQKVGCTQGGVSRYLKAARDNIEQYYRKAM